MKERLRLEVRVARKPVDVLRCQYLIAAVYNKHYDIVFSTDITDLNAKIEPYPHRYAMGIIDGELVAAVGLYVDKTYVERFGKVTDDEVQSHLRLAGATKHYSPQRKRELTKLVIKPGWDGKGIGKFFFAASHSRHFLQVDTAEPALLLTCAKASIFRNLHESVGIKTRRIKEFPKYRVHERYCSPDDPMDSRLIIPDIDIPPRWYDLSLPGEYDVVPLGVSS